MEQTPDPTAMDLTALGLSGSASRILTQLLTVGERSIAQLALETGVAASVVSRAVRDLLRRELVRQSYGRPATVAVAPGIGDAVRGLAAEVRSAAQARGTALDRLSRQLTAIAPQRDAERERHWLVPLRADAILKENEVRRVTRRFDACVPAGCRPRGVPVRAVPHLECTWRVLVQESWPIGISVPRRCTLEVRRRRAVLPWLEIVDQGMVGVQVIVKGCMRTAWCNDRGQVALAVAGFERWWADAEPVDVTPSPSMCPSREAAGG